MSEVGQDDRRRLICNRTDRMDVRQLEKGERFEISIYGRTVVARVEEVEDQ